MSIRNLAQELYKVQKKVETLEKELAGLSEDSPRRKELEAELNLVRKEKERLKDMLEKAKLS